MPGRPPITSRKGARQSLPWTALSDDELLHLRFSDLKLRLPGSRLEQRLRRIYGELESRGITFRPHMWLAEEWFSPDGVPGIAVPFYLAHPRLMRLERRMMRQVEGGNDNWMMRILRHEAGHAIDTAFRLRRRARWREVFGPASLPYPDSYQRAPGQPPLRAAPGRLVCAEPSDRGFRRDLRRLAEAQVRLAPHLCELAGMGQAGAAWTS